MDYAAYCRKSTDDTGLGVRAQETEIRAYAGTHGLNLLRVYVEPATTAADARHRPVFEEMKTAIKAGEIQGIICTDTDRLVRHIRDLEPLLDLVEKNGLDIQTTRSTMFDLTTPQGRMIARQLAVMGSWEIEHLRQRQSASHVHRATNGTFRGGSIPFGYQSGDKPGELVPHPVNAGLVRDATQMILAGQGLLTVTTRWNKAGVKTVRGNNWRATGLRKLLLTPTIAGLSHYKGEVVGRGSWEPLISETDWQKMRLILTNPDRRTTKNNYQGQARKHMLSGVLECGLCGSKLASNNPSQGRKMVYQCKGCSRITIQADRVEEYISQLVVGKLIEKMETLNVNEPVKSDVDVERLTNQRNELVDRLDQLSELFADGVLNQSQLVAGTEKINTQIQAIDEQISSHINEPLLDRILAKYAIPGSREKFYWDYDRATKSMKLSGTGKPQAWVIKAIFDRENADSQANTIKALMTVTVLPSSRKPAPVSERVHIEWK